MSKQPLLVKTFLEDFDHFSYNRALIPQEKLDLANKYRTSLFPWRGQFSPELVELFLDQFSSSTTAVFDPFAGSGTTLFECATKNLTCYGTEINPAAVAMADTVHFVNISPAERERHFCLAESLVTTMMQPFHVDLFNYQEFQNSGFGGVNQSASLEQSFVPMLQQAKTDPLAYSLILNAILRYASYRQPTGAADFLRAFREHKRLVERLPYTPTPCKLLHSDARSVSLASSSIDLIITSPPYINVFNYHQNNRSIMEFIGWDLLTVAKSEIGSNRKHRQNRFLTVIQYALDMADTLREMKRLLSSKGRIIIVMGRESSIRGVSFKNARLVAALAVGVVGFRLVDLQERKFKNKFGEIIYEDILHLLPETDSLVSDEGEARELARLVLKEAAESALESIRPEILEALTRADQVKASPLFKLAAL
jgi:methylase of polypeptide subunit release factors